MSFPEKIKPFQLDTSEKPKRKRYSPYEAYVQRLKDIEREAAYQRELADEEYARALRLDAYPADLIRGGVMADEEDHYFVTYKDER